MPTPATGQRTGLRAWIDEVVLHRGATPEDEAAWRAQADGHMLRAVPPIAAFCLAAIVGWFVLDAVLLGHDPGVSDVHLRPRLFVAALATCALAVLAWRPAQRHVRLVLVLTGHSLCVVVASSLSAPRPGGTIWFDVAYILPWVTVPILVGLGVRLVLTMTTAVLPAALFVALHPEALGAPNLGRAAALFVYVLLLAVMTGHTGYHLVRTDFFRARDLAERSRQLRELAAMLESRVAAQTRELRALAAHVEQVRESEKSALSRELHDELGQSHAAMQIELELLRRRLDDCPAEVADHVARLETMLDEVQARTRVLVGLLRPRILDDLGLAAALEWLVAETRRRSGLDVTLRLHPEDPEVDAAVATAAFRIVEEALTNVRRHAGATRVEVQVASVDGRLVLEVTDDGRGLGPEQGRSGGMGLVGLRERVRALGGTVEIGPRPGGGTRVVAALPVTDPVSIQEMVG